MEHVEWFLGELCVSADRKLKKLLHTMKAKVSAEEDRAEERPPQQWNLDYALAPFEGLTPEYMEMSEYTQVCVCVHVLQ